MVGQTVGYVRVSSAEQNLDRQLEAVGECDRIFQDVISGSPRAKRTGLAELMRYVREGDLVKVVSMDRLGRDALAAWPHQYNHHRPHTACGNQPPFSRLINAADEHPPLAYARRHAVVDSHVFNLHLAVAPIDQEQAYQVNCSRHNHSQSMIRL